MASSCHQWGRGHAVPLSQDWWPKKDPKAAATIPAWSQPLWPLQDSQNAGRHEANRGHGCDMLPACNWGRGPPILVASWQRRVGRRGGDTVARDGVGLSFGADNPGSPFCSWLPRSIDCIYLIKFRCPVPFHEEIGVKGMGSLGPSTHTGSLSNKWKHSYL